MYIQAITAFFKYKVVGSVIVLTCWPSSESVNLIREISQHGLSATSSCNFPAVFDNLKKAQGHKLQGVLYVMDKYDNLLEKVKLDHFASYYKWLIVGDKSPDILHRVRYDADISLLSLTRNESEAASNGANVGFSHWHHSVIPDNPPDGSWLPSPKHRHLHENRIDMPVLLHCGFIAVLKSTANSPTVFFQDVYIHPRDGPSIHPWAIWTQPTGFMLTHEREKILRRLDLKKYPMRIATPVGQYSEEWYNGPFGEYLADEKLSELDSAIRCGYGGSELLIERLSATKVLVPTLLWGTDITNDSMVVKLEAGDSELSGGVLRLLITRLSRFNFVTPVWPFHVGFTYLAERESSSNMYVEPFAVDVWWSCLGIGVILAIAQRITSKSSVEKDGAYVGTLATWLQQDASAVPEGASGRWTFMVLSIASMLVHAYYTSAIVSALMSTGISGPDSLRSLGDSRYAIASEDYDYMRYHMFDVKTNWADLEYLKRKKMTTNFFQEIVRGVELIEQGNTAFHAEYNHLFPYFKKFSDDHICKLQYVDTIPQIMAWIVTTPNGQWTEVFRSSGIWLHETGLVKRLVSRLRARPPHCRSSMLAERVKFGDVAPLLMVTVGGAVLSLVLLGLEFLRSRWEHGKNPARTGSAASVETAISDQEDYSN